MKASEGLLAHLFQTDPLKANKILYLKIPNPMEQQLKAGYGSQQYNGIRLQQLIDGLVGNSLPIAKSKGSVVVNEVGRGVVLQKVNAELIDLLQNLLTAVIEGSKRGDIHIRAVKIRNQLVLSIIEKNNYNGYALAYRIGVLAYEAALVGGELDIETPQQLKTTISLRLPAGVAA